jgi:EmrB/QacA subfamily drug resistance transporter
MTIRKQTDGVSRSVWLPLVVLALAQFMVVLDVTIVNVALPHIQSDLHFSPDGLQWIISAYTLAFGGFLLLGGRTADLLGRRTVFINGLTVFSAASLLAGLSSSSTMLVAARAAQGLGGALLSPAALAVLTVTYAAGRERNLALGVWGALAGLGGTLGLVIGGVLVDSVGWQAVFFVNVPIGAGLIAIAPRLIGESKLDDGNRGLDIPGALLGTGGLLALVFGVVRAQPLGWGSAEVAGSLALGVTMLVGFVVVESRARSPLVPMRLFRSRALRTGSAALALNGAAFLAMFFLTAVFLQQVRGNSALSTGIQLLPMGLAAIIAAVAVSRLVTAIGTRAVQIAGATLSVAGLLWISTVGVHTAYLTGLLPGFALYGAGILSINVPAQISAVTDFTRRDAGSASALVTTGFQVGGALGLAIISTIASSGVAHSLAAGKALPDALTAGFHIGLLLAAGFAAINLAIALMSSGITPDSQQLAEAAAVG